MGKLVQRLLHARLRVLPLILMASLLTLTAYGQGNTELELGKSSTYQKLKDNELKYYMVRIDENKFDGDQDLVIKVQSSDFYGDPDLYISKKNKQPNSKENSDQQCATYGKDICTVNHKFLTAGQYVYIGVKCLQECKFSLRAALTSQVELDDSDEKQLDFEAEESKIFKFYIPAKSAASDDQNRVHSVTITAVPLLTLNDNIVLAASTKADVLPNSSSRKGVPGWRKGQVLRLTDTSPEEWCNDCWITILVDVSDAGKYSIMAKSNVGILQLQTDKKVDEVAFYGDKTCYKYYVQSAEHDMVLKVQQFSGLISFTVNPKKPAESFDTSKFKHVSSQNSNLLITADERQKVGQAKGLYYICAVPHMTSTYSLLVKEPSKFQIFSYLEDGYDENGEIQGKNMTLLVYKVPPLEYQGEDIQLNFRLNVISGEKPVMAAKFCQDAKDHRKCAINQTAENVVNAKSSYKKANIVGKDLSLVIDHDERACQDVYKGECYYVIAIVGQSKEEEFTKFEIKVSHSQLNYELLQEGSILTDYVDMGLYRYYSFTLMQDPKVKKVSFRLNTLHGDADIFVSRKHRNPNKIDYEKSSVKTGAMIDEVHFDDGNLATTYYIGVYSFQYSTYNLVVKVEREGKASQDSIPQLSEGIPYTGSIKNEKSHDSYRLVVKQLEGFEKSIKIQAQQVKGKIDFYVNYGEPATDKKYIWAQQSGVVNIPTNHKSFKREGTYYIAVYPRLSFWSKFTDDTYSYMISYSTQDSYTYIQSQAPVEATQKKDSYQYFRHFVTKKTQDITVSMTVYSGNPQLYVSISPNKKQPNATEHEFNTWNQPIINGNKGKAIQLSNQQLQKSNSVCSSSISTNADVEPCAIYMGVYCDADCKYSLKLSYQSDAPQQLVIGMPQHDIVKQDQYNYYYIMVRENKTKQIYAVLNSLAGNADLYVRYQENPHTKTPENWKGPSSSDYALKSTDVFQQDMVIIKPENLKQCFQNFKSDGIQDERLCAIIFGIHSPQNSASDDQTARYNFVVYSDVTYLSNGATVSGKVDENEFQYYIFDALCADCPIIVSVSTFSTGDPDLYIKFGDTQLPTTTSYDVLSTTFMSELLRIDLEDPQIKSKGIKTLKGTIIVGVYGKKKSDYQISVSQEKNPITSLNAGLSLKISQKPFETTYFMFYQAQEDVDFKLTVAVKSGKVDLLMNTFQDTKESQNFASRLPKSKRNSLWQVDGISSMSQIADKGLIVVNNEKNYCSHCYYLIGISSQEQRSEYSILVHNLEADFNNSLLLKIGETYHEEINKTDLKSYKFVIDDLANFQVQISMIKGYAYSYINLIDSKEDPLFSAFSTSTITVKKDDPNFHTGRLYYLILEGNTDCEYIIVVQQDSHAITLSDGIPTKIQFFGAEDIQKNFLFHLTEGESRMSLQLKTLNDGFYPFMYYRLYEDLDLVEKIEYPPAGPHDFWGSERFDKNFKVMTYDRQFTGIKGKNSALAISVYAGHSEYDMSKNPSMTLTITQSSIIKMLSNQMYVGSFKHQTQQLVYSSEDFLFYQQGYIAIEFSACAGNPVIDVVGKPEDKYTNTMTEFIKNEQNGRIYYYIPLPRENLYILVRPEQDLNTGQTIGLNTTQFLIKVKYSMLATVNNVNYQYQGNDNSIQYSDYSVWTSNVNLTWNKLLWFDNMGGIRDAKATYTILISKKDRIRLDTQCAMRQNISNEYYYLQYNSNFTHFILPNIQVGVKYYLNVFGSFKISSVQEAEIVPYEPIVLFIDNESTTSLSQISKNFLVLKFTVLFMLFIIGVIGAVILIFKQCCKSKPVFYKPKGPSKHIEYELTNIHQTNTSRVGEYQVPTELIKGMGETDALNRSSNGY